MKNYFKKFSIMVIMLLAVIGVGVIQDRSVANAATVGQQLTAPESGWKRIDDVDVFKNAVTTGNWTSTKMSSPYLGDGSYNDTATYTTDTNAKLTFEFYGSKFRLCARTSINRATDAKIIVDGTEFTIDEAKYSGTCTLMLNLDTLENKTHIVTFVPGTNGTGNEFIFDCIDIDNSGKLISPAISLDQSSMDLTESDSKQLTATTTPAGAQVNWSSSDKSVATVENGNVTGVKEGQVTITSTINDGSNASATCTVNVIPKTSEPTEPQDPTGDGTLFIELVDGNIKSYDVSSQEITNFINWYKNRDLDDSQSPVYKFKKGDYTDYVVHDKIDWFEVR